MTPSSPALLWLCPLVAVVVVVAAAVFTSRTPRRLVGAAMNLAGVAVSALVVCACVGLVLNEQNSWYSSWADFFPSREAHVQTAGARNPAETFGADAGAHLTRVDDRALPPLPRPGQRVQSLTVRTSIGRINQPVTIVLPRDYFSPEAATKAYPVLFAGHGVPGAPKQWLGPLNIRGYLDPLVDAHRISDAIVVIPALEPQGADTECVFGPGGPDQMETWLDKDLPAWVQSHLRAIPERTAWAWIGFSAGGWCGAMMAMRHPDRFAGAVVLSGYFRAWWAGRPPWSASDPRNRSYDLISLAEEHPPRVAIWVLSTRTDHESWPQTSTFLSRVRSPMFVTAEVKAAGGHNFSTWRPGVPQGLTWLGQTVPGFAP